MKIIGWNCRSLTRNKILYINYLIETHNPDYFIIWETWLDSKPSFINQNYELYQTKFSRYQGVWIIARKNSINKIHINDEHYIIAIESKINGRTQIIIGVYFRQNNKHKILAQTSKLIKRINKTYANQEIVLFWDLNPDCKFTPELIEKTLNLKCSLANKIMTTRVQKRVDEINESTLDFFFSSQQIQSLEKLEKFESDHYPIKAEIKITGMMRKTKKNLTIMKTVINETKIRDFIKNSEWPTYFDKKYSRQLTSNKLIIRPTIKLQNEANNIFKKGIKWEMKQIHLGDACKENFKNYTKNLNLQCTKDSAKFYKIINSLIKYKIRGKITKGITQGNEIMVGKEKNEIIINYFKKKLYDGPKITPAIESNGIFDFRVNIRRGLDWCATNKAAGLDGIPGELYKITKINELLLERLQLHFTEYTRCMSVPDYFMKAKLILISKDGTEYPKIDETRPISILPTITKVFELTILHFLEQATLSPKFWNDQRGFRKGNSTLNNINDVLQTFRDLQTKRKYNKNIKPAILFFDFKKAYDSISRNILLKKLRDFEIPINIINLISTMLKKFTLIYENSEIKTYRGLVQGSVLSPLLFNLYINDLLLSYRNIGIFTRAYADDIIWIWNSIEELKIATAIMKKLDKRKWNWNK